MTKCKKLLTLPSLSAFMTSLIVKTSSLTWNSFHFLVISITDFLVIPGSTSPVSNGIVTSSFSAIIQLQSTLKPTKTKGQTPKQFNKVLKLEQFTQNIYVIANRSSMQNENIDSNNVYTNICGYQYRLVSTYDMICVK